MVVNHKVLITNFLRNKVVSNTRRPNYGGIGVGRQNPQTAVKATLHKLVVRAILLGKTTICVHFFAKASAAIRLSLAKLRLFFMIKTLIAAAFLTALPTTLFAPTADCRPA